MPVAYSSFGAAAVATIYIIYGAYRDYMMTQVRREQTLRERVTYLLWAMASQVD